MLRRGRQAARSLLVLIDHPIAPGSAGGFFDVEPRPPGRVRPVRISCILCKMTRLAQHKHLDER